MQLERAEQNMPAPPDMVKLLHLVRQFHRAVDLQNRRDSETVASLVRVLSKPHGADAEQFAEYVRSIVKQELTNKRTD
jgi:hypothetical protein